MIGPNSLFFLGAPGSCLAQESGTTNSAASSSRDNLTAKTPGNTIWPLDSNICSFFLLWAYLLVFDNFVAIVKFKPT